MQLVAETPPVESTETRCAMVAPLQLTPDDPVLQETSRSLPAGLASYISVVNVRSGRQATGLRNRHLQYAGLAPQHAADVQLWVQPPQRSHPSGVRAEVRALQRRSDTVIGT